MKPLIFRSSTWFTCAMVLYSGSLWAAHMPNRFNPSLPTEINRVSRITEEVRRNKIWNNTQNTFALLRAEMALAKGQDDFALKSYLYVLQEHPTPDVAERAIELAISQHQFVIAEQIFEIWEKISPQPSPMQRRIKWTRALSQGDTQYAFSHLDNIIRESNEEQIRRIFLLLVQISLKQADITKAGSEPIHKLAKQYPNMIEAIVADLIFSMGVRQEDWTMAALKQLSRIDPELSDASRLAVSLIVRDQASILAEFFKKNDSKHLSSAWQELEIEQLLEARQYQAAQTRLQQLLAMEQPSANLYFMAAAQANQESQGDTQSIQYLEKAYEIGNMEQQSRAAALIALKWLADKQFAQVMMWIDRIQSEQYAFDKNVLEILLASEQENWQKVVQLYTNHQDLKPNLKTHLFDESHREQPYFYALLQSQNPHKTLVELNKLLKKAQQQGDNARIGTLVYHRGLLYSDKLNRVNDAIKDLRYYLAMNPDNANAQNSLGYILLSRPEFLEEGFQLIQKAYQKQPESAAFNDSMGWAYFLKGDFQTALLYLQYAYRQDKNVEIAAHLGELYWQMGEHDQAQSVWKEGWLKNKHHAVLQQTLRKYKILF